MRKRVMNSKPLIPLCLLLLSGCPTTLPNEDGGSRDNSCRPPNPDMTALPVPCAAAKGLAGSNLLCVDFASIPDQPLGASPPTKLAGWDFVTSCGGMNWEIANGKLQIKSFGQFSSTCGLTLPSFNLNDNDKKKYQSLTLSIVQRVDVSSPKQTVQGFLGSATPSQAFWITTGNSEHQQLTITMSRTDPVPVATNGNYQYLLQIVSSVMAGGTAQGWQIESIAVMANQ